MKKKYMLIVVLGLSMLAGCGTNDEKTTELSLKSESSVTTDTEETTEDIIEKEDTKSEGTEDVTTSESIDDTQKVQDETQEVTADESQGDVTEAEQAESNEANTDGQTSSDFYEVATSKSAEEVEAFAANIRNLIINKDWNALAKELHYPFTMNGSTVENSSDFLALDLDGKLNQAFVDVIEAESCKEMFCNYQGIMLGQGHVWIVDVQNENGDFELKVFSINGMLEQ